MVGESLVIVRAGIAEIGGGKWRSGRSGSSMSRMEILGQEDGTDAGTLIQRLIQMGARYQ